jgi:hydroxypyruvate isomerase
MLRFGINVSILLREYPFLERFDQAARLGFDTVEFWWPAGEDLRMVARRIRDAGLHVALINFDGGDIARGERGLVNDPARQAQFHAHVPAALELAERVGCRRMNALAGKWRAGEERGAQLERVRANLAWVAGQARDASVTVLIEALNAWENPGYLCTSTREALALIDSLGAPNVQLQYDIYHMQRMEGNIVATSGTQIGRIGHIQFADSPGRHQPGTGELRFPFIFEAIAASGYSGVVSLEYNPLGSSEASLAWLPPDRREPIPVEALRL